MNTAQAYEKAKQSAEKMRQVFEVDPCVATATALINASVRLRAAGLQAATEHGDAIVIKAIELTLAACPDKTQAISDVLASHGIAYQPPTPPSAQARSQEEAQAPSAPSEGPAGTAS